MRHGQNWTNDLFVSKSLKVRKIQVFKTSPLHYRVAKYPQGLKTSKVTVESLNLSAWMMINHVSFYETISTRCLLSGQGIVYISSALPRWSLRNLSQALLNSVYVVANDFTASEPSGSHENSKQRSGL